MTTSAISDLRACKHAREFFNAAGLVEFSDTDLRASLQRFFLHDEMAVCKARDLRLVRDTQHLVRLRELLEFKTHGFADATANPCVDLVKHDRARKLGSVRHSLQHKHQ